MAGKRDVGPAVMARLAKGEASLSELYEAAGAARGEDVPQSTVRQWCNQATNDGRIKRVGRGRYGLPG
jgi:hypothetical protein